MHKIWRESNKEILLSIGRTSHWNKDHIIVANKDLRDRSETDGQENDKFLENKRKLRTIKHGLPK